MRFVTLTLHPAIDRILRVATLVPGDTFDAQVELTVPSGKGVNTARSLRHVTGPRSAIHAVAWIGAGESEWFARELSRLSKVSTVLCQRDCPTRLANTILETSARETHIKESMATPSPREASALLRCWSAAIRPGDIVAVCGSAPRGTKAETLRRVFNLARERKAAAVIADTNGAALEIAGAAGIDGIKGNAAEIGAWLGLSAALDPENQNHRRAVQAAFERRGAPKSIVVTMGPRGAMYLTRDTLLLAEPPRVAKDYIVTTTGCGDAATAGWMWALRDRSDDAELLRRVVGCGTAKLNSADPGSLQAHDVHAFLKRISPKKPS